MSVSTLEADLELKTSTYDFLKIFSTKLYELATISPDIIQSVELVDGEWGVPGFVILSNYTLDGKAQVAKLVVEDINVTSLSMTFKVTGGDLLEEYNSFKVVMKLSAQVLGGSVVHWTMEYEKPNEDTADPNSLMQEALQVSKDIDAYVGSLI